MIFVIEGFPATLTTMANLKGNHKCPACGLQTTFTLTDLDEKICDACLIPVSVGSPVKRLRVEMLEEQKTVQELQSLATLDGPVPDAVNDVQRIFLVTTNLLMMLKETIAIMEDNRLLVGDNYDETAEYIKYAEEELNSIKNKYK